MGIGNLIKTGSKAIGARGLLTQKLGNLGLLLKAKKPEILLGVGLVGIGVGTYMLCKSSKKAEVVMNQHKWEIRKIKDDKDPELGLFESKHEYNKAIFDTWKDTVVDLGKVYGSAVIVYGFGVTCVLTSFKVMHERQLALVAAYTGLEKLFDKYRSRVKKLVGEEIEGAIYRGERLNVEIEDEETGEKKIVTVDEDKEMMGKYDIWWDRESSASFDENREYAYNFLKGTEKNMNEKLWTNGHLFLNEVYSALGVNHTPNGAICGWRIAKDGPLDSGEVGDEEVKFEIHEEMYTDWDRDGSSVRTGRNPVAYRIDFNCDKGVIWDKI